jgi:3-oxoacyl-[acyl-carrier protein] reductase
MDLKLNGKRALITGASRGLGYATALGLGREGARLAINSRSSEAIQSAANKIHAQTGAEVYALAGDASEPSVPERLVQEVVDGLGGLDILITNTGGPPTGNFEGFDDETWHKAVELSFLSHVRLIRAALPVLRRSEAASVLTITSYTVKQPAQNLILSNSVRAATIGLTKSLALELSKEGIRFNSILPGWTETERVQQILANRAKANQTQVEQEYARQVSEIPLGRMGQPEEFANAAVFMVSPAAAFINGVMLPVDGGIIKSSL